MYTNYSFINNGACPYCSHNLGTLKVLGTVGEPINPEAWLWYYNEVGHEKCSVVDTYWQTETVSMGFYKM
jgi:acetyl-CoA synthetase